MAEYLSNGTRVARCPICPAQLVVERDGDRIEHVGPIVYEYPWGEHRFIPESDGDAALRAGSAHD